MSDWLIKEPAGRSHPALSASTGTTTTLTYAPRFPMESLAKYAMARTSIVSPIRAITALFGSHGMLDRASGALIGLAVGDAVGTTLEFSEPGTFAPVSDMTGGGPFGLEPGQWTDDTSMALCLGASLVEKGFDIEDQVKRYLDWRDNGYMSVNGRCFDIGSTVDAALRKYQRTGNPNSGQTGPEWSGNGSIMRLAPVPLYFHDNATLAVDLAGESSRTTHGSEMCVDSCRYLSAVIWGFVNGEKELPDLPDAECCEPVLDIVRRDYLGMEPPEIKSTGFVIDTLRAALWAFSKTDNFRDGLLLAVNLGGDADTAGAVYGQIAGAYYGLDGIPPEWVKRVHWSARIIEMAESLVCHTE